MNALETQLSKIGRFTSAEVHTRTNGVIHTVYSLSAGVRISALGTLRNPHEFLCEITIHKNRVEVSCVSTHGHVVENIETFLQSGQFPFRYREPCEHDAKIEKIAQLAPTVAEILRSIAFIDSRESLEALKNASVDEWVELEPLAIAPHITTRGGVRYRAETTKLYLAWETSPTIRFTRPKARQKE